MWAFYFWVAAELIDSSRFWVILFHPRSSCLEVIGAGVEGAGQRRVKAKYMMEDSQEAAASCPTKSRLGGAWSTYNFSYSTCAKRTHNRHKVECLYKMRKYFTKLENMKLLSIQITTKSREKPNILFTCLIYPFINISIFLHFVGCKMLADTGSLFNKVANWENKKRNFAVA